MGFVVVCFVLFCFLRDKESHYVDQAGIELTEIYLLLWDNP